MSRRNIAVIVSYYNFSGSRSRQLALWHCLESLPGDVEVILVAMGKKPKISDNVTLVEISQGGILWQRERFWNVALERMGSHNDIVVWIDADVVFADDLWVGRLEEQLTQSTLVHLFSVVTDAECVSERLAPTRLVRQSIVRLGERAGNGVFQQYFSKSGISLSLGYNPGFAWATSACVIKSLGFPDFLILGSGDKAFLAAAMGYQREYAAALKLNPWFTRRYFVWAERVHEHVGGRVGYIDNHILHVVQGAYEGRHYRDRYRLIESPEFVLPGMLEINEEGAWDWTHDGNRYAKRIEAYFQGRND